MSDLTLYDRAIELMGILRSQIKVATSEEQSPFARRRAQLMLQAHDRMLWELMNDMAAARGRPHHFKE